jgi:hypothetical protein
VRKRSIFIFFGIFRSLVWLFQIQKRFPSVLFGASGIRTYILAAEVRKQLVQSVDLFLVLHAV